MKNFLYKQKFFILLFFYFQITIALTLPHLKTNRFKSFKTYQLHKRQVSIDDLLNTALQLVRPIFDTSNLENEIIPKRITLEDSPGIRESTILGAPIYSSIRDVPICRGNSQICKFISCTARNFKYDQNFSNLNLAVQLIGDQDFRRTISKNPEAINTVCHEQGLSIEQCKIFSRSFQLIDRVITTIQKPEKNLIINDHPNVETFEIEEEKAETGVLKNNFLKPLNDATFINNSNNVKTLSSTIKTTNSNEWILKKKNHIQPMNYLTINKSISSKKILNQSVKRNPSISGSIGSRTWSTHENNNKFFKQFEVDEQPIIAEVYYAKNKKNLTSSKILNQSKKNINLTTSSVINYKTLEKLENVKNKSHKYQTKVSNASDQLNFTKNTNYLIPHSIKPQISENLISRNKKKKKNTSRTNHQQNKTIERPKMTTIKASNLIFVTGLAQSTNKTNMTQSIDNLTSISKNNNKNLQKIIIPEAEEDYDENITKSRIKRFTDYYDNVENNEKFEQKNFSSNIVSDGLKTPIGKTKLNVSTITKINCFQYLG